MTADYSPAGTGCTLLNRYHCEYFEHWAGNAVLRKAFSLKTLAALSELSDYKTKTPQKKQTKKIHFLIVAHERRMNNFSLLFQLNALLVISETC